MARTHELSKKKKHEKDISRQIYGSEFMQDKTKNNEFETHTRTHIGQSKGDKNDRPKRRDRLFRMGRSFYSVVFFSS